MIRLPGICEECGAIYPSPLRAGAAEAAPAFEVPASCPVCGGSGRIPPEVLDRLTATMEAAGSLGEDRETLDWLEDLLEEVALDPGEELGPDEERVRRARLGGRVDSRVESGPDLVAGLPGFRPGEVKAFLRLLRVAVDLGVTDRLAGEAERVGVDSLLTEAYERHGPEEGSEPTEPGPAERARRRLRDAGRNDPCPCGSGEKYKDCHWVEDLRETR